jgi:cytochrome c biogenesis protein CcmG/thiol:disulfide interchange protein DsbE
VNRGLPAQKPRPKEPRKASERAVYCHRFWKPCISSGGGARFSNSLTPIKAPEAASECVLLVTAAAVRRFARMRLALTAVLVALLVAGCGQAEPKSQAPSSAQVKQALAGAPPKLAALHRQANQLLGGSKSEFDARMAQLRGYPVVVNKWASWCAPCRGEFPAFQRAALQLGKKVAFLGLDGNDPDDSARKFLAQYPVTYPSYRDPAEKIGPSIQAGIAYPTTVFFNRKGRLIYAHPGPYKTAADLIADIKRYAL